MWRGSSKQYQTLAKFLISVAPSARSFACTAEWRRWPKRTMACSLPCIQGPTVGVRVWVVERRWRSKRPGRGRGRNDPRPVLSLALPRPAIGLR